LIISIGPAEKALKLNKQTTNARNLRINELIFRKHNNRKKLALAKI
jgi:hypothetical protein